MALAVAPAAWHSVVRPFDRETFVTNLGDVALPSSSFLGIAQRQRHVKAPLARPSNALSVQQPNVLGVYDSGLGEPVLARARRHR